MHNDQKLPAVIAIVGPTCTGKTDLSLALAYKLNGEIVALDSRTIYKKMDIGTAKPSQAQQREVKHHAIDILEPNKFLTLAEYVEIATQAISRIIAQDKLPILCGGTGLYARALLEGIQIPAIAPQLELRQELENYAQQYSNEKLHQRLAEVDPLSASRLNVNDKRRIIRALEVYIISGKPFSELATTASMPYRTTWLGLMWQDRSKHKQLIKQRLDKQLQEGLLNEVKYLWQELSYREVLANSVNYKEFIPYFENKENLDQALQQCIQNNFQLARKQMIWFRARKFINWYALDNLTESNSIDALLKHSLNLVDLSLAKYSHNPLDV